MNYPLKNAIVDFCLWGDGDALYNTLTEIYSSYPRAVSDKLMNLLGTHDTERILTVLGRDMGDEDAPNSVLATKRLSDEQKNRGAELLKIASVLQYTSYGIPSLFYGDEVGLEGYGDPLCRMPFPWNDPGSPLRLRLLEHYRALGRIRREEAFDSGDFYIIRHTESDIVFVREKNDCRIIVAANRGERFLFDIPSGERYVDLISGAEHQNAVLVEKNTAAIWKVVKN
jgi:glycosidase